MRKFLKFTVSGGVAALSKLACFYFMFSILHVFYLVSSAAAFVLSSIVGFFMQKYFTFNNLSKEDMHQQANIFFFVSFVNLGVNLIIMYVFVGLLGIKEMLAQFITLGIIALWNFFIYQNFIFKKKEYIL